jgi:uncharacterized sodium:solute symporter family permease YidK
MSASAFSSDNLVYPRDVPPKQPPKQPPKILFVVGLLSVLLGTLIGGYGIFSAGTSSNSRQYLLGFFGYVLTALIPIIVLQILVMTHKKDLANNETIQYDDYSGLKMQDRFKKVVLSGLISAVLSIYIFFLPIAERFATP